MRRSFAISSLVGRLTQYGVVRVENLGSSYTTMVQSHRYGNYTGGGRDSYLKEHMLTQSGLRLVDVRRFTSGTGSSNLLGEVKKSWLLLDQVRMLSIQLRQKILSDYFGLKKVVQDVRLKVEQLTLIYCDKAAAISIDRSLVQCVRAAHTEINKNSSSETREQEEGDAHAALNHGQEIERSEKPRIGENVSRKDRFNFLVSTLLDLKDSKQTVYGALDAWVAWEQNFPLASLRRALAVLETQHKWHRIVQVIKWMLSKGQGNTMGTYGMLIRALDMDHRAEEAHRFWVKKIGSDLHSVPWSLCTSMIGIYYRNNMLEHLIKLYKGLEAFDRKPPEKSIVQRVADAYEVSGLVEEKTRLLEKYDYLFTESDKGSMKHTRSTSKKGKKSGRKKKTDLPLESSMKTGTNNQEQERNWDAASAVRHSSSILV